MALDDLTDIDDAFGHWLAGFIDGEACFQISKSADSQRQRNFGYVCQFTIDLRADDGAILSEIHRRTGIGSVKLMAPRGPTQWNPSVRWITKSKPDCANLVLLLDRYPLRAKKAADYAIWRQAVHAWHQKRKGGDARWAGRENDWSDMATLMAELRALRAYAGPPLSLSAR